MTAALLAIFVFALVALAVFAVISLFDQRQAQARLIKERRSDEQQLPENALEQGQPALVRDEQLSNIPAIDSILRRSARVSAIQKMLQQAGLGMRAGDFLGLCAICGIVAGIVGYNIAKRVEFGWIALLVGFLLPYSYVSFRRSKRFEQFEEMFPQAIDILLLCLVPTIETL